MNMHSRSVRKYNTLPKTEMGEGDKSGLPVSIRFLHISRNFALFENKVITQSVIIALAPGGSTYNIQC